MIDNLILATFWVGVVTIVLGAIRIAIEIGKWVLA